MSECLWVTGVGLTTALGVGTESTWDALVRGDRAIAPVTQFDASDQRVNLAAEVGALPRLGASIGPVARTSALAVTAAVEAMTMANLRGPGLRLGLVVGSTTGGLLETELLLARLHAEPGHASSLEGLRIYPLTGPADAVDRAAGPFARIRTVSSACSSGANAIVVAASWLLAGELDAVVAGGADSLCRLTLTGFNALAALDPASCRPFDRRRRGTSLGEGAGFLVLEKRDAARARGAEGLAELAGWASGADAYHVTNPDPSGRVVVGLIAEAMARADLTPRDVDYVNAHGTGTPANDAAEATALGAVFGREVDRVPVSSSKGQLGHTLGAAGAIEAAITALVVSRGVLVPTGGLEEPDPALRLVHVPRIGRPVEQVRAALSNAFGFGGMNAVLAFRTADVRRATRAPERARVVVVGAGSLTEGSGALDVDRSRRFDDASRRMTAAAVDLLAASGASSEGCGALLGTAFGTVDGTGAFMHRVASKGTRFASPADFPNLLPSTSAGHVSIYTGLTGPLFAIVDTSASGANAILDSVRLVETGVAPRMLAGPSGIRRGPIVDALARLVDPDGASIPEDDAACLLLVEADAEARRRGGRVLAEIVQLLEWRGDAAEAPSALRPPATASAAIFPVRLGADALRALEGTSWGPRVPKTHADARPAGLQAFQAAVAHVAGGVGREALVWADLGRGGFAVVLASASDAEGAGER